MKGAGESRREEGGAKSGRNRSKIFASQPSGLGSKQRIGPEFPKPRVCRQASPKAFEQVVEADPKEPRRKRLLPVVVLLARKGRQSRSPECPECGCSETVPEVKLPETFEGYAAGKSLPVGLDPVPGFSEAGTGFGFGVLSSGAPGNITQQLRNEFASQIGRKKEAFAPYARNRMTGAQAQSWIFHRQNFKKTSVRKVPDERDRSRAENPRTRSHKTGIFYVYNPERACESA